MPLPRLGLDQRHAEEIGPLLDQIPDMPIRELGVLRGTGEFPGLSDLVENTEHHHRGLRAAFLVKSPDGSDLDVVHGQTYEIDCISEADHRQTISYLLKDYNLLGLEYNKRRKYDVDCI